MSLEEVESTTTPLGRAVALSDTFGTQIRMSNDTTRVGHF